MAAIDLPLASLDRVPALPSGGLNLIAYGLIAGGAVGLALAAGFGLGMVFAGVLAGTCLIFALTVASLFFTAAHVLGGAHWIVPVRRLIDGLSAGLPIAVGGAVVLLAVGGAWLYEWVSQTGAEHAKLFHAADGTKAAWMTTLRWAGTSFLILGFFVVARGLLVGTSLRRDAGAVVDGSEARWSVVTLIVGIFAFTLFVWDYLLSIELTFPNAIWGFYCLANGVQVFLGVLTLVAVWLASTSLRGLFRRHLFHDLGTWLLAWGCIVAYLTLAQFVIIYFANLDEETGPILKRLQHGYGAVYVIEAILRSAVPFVVLMSQSLRTHPAALTVAAVSAILGNLLDLAWWIVPALAPNHFEFAFGLLPVVLIALGFLGGALLLAQGFWRRNGVLPTDPRLIPTINGEHLH
ncbi:hypothetical protein LBMAG53_36110 [Planctomycetota bacterium]|nr:hypothetical protein LBMAG53_36110 [Planctomycetota bacterium]